MTDFVMTDWNSRRAIRWLRWVMLIPAVYASWSVALFTGYTILSYVESRCPPELMVSGHCTARWFEFASTAASSTGAAIAAVLIVLSCTLVAPSHRYRVAGTTFVIGATVAVAMGVLAMAWAEMLSAIAAGGIATLWIRRRVG
jgi:hypothetical protein